MVFYDIVNMMPTSFDYKKEPTAREPLSVGKGSQDAVGLNEGTLSSVKENVNTDFSEKEHVFTINGTEVIVNPTDEEYQQIITSV